MNIGCKHEAQVHLNVHINITLLKTPVRPLITDKPTQLQVCQWSVNSSLFITVAGRNKLALYVPRFNFGSPPKSRILEFSNSQSIEFELNIQILVWL